MNEHHHALPEGYQLMEYRIDGILGTGGFGITYLGWDANLDKQVAIKEYLPGEYAVRLEGETVAPKSTEDEDDYAWGLERFLDEARALARFDHPNINRVLRFFEANNTAYLVLEYVEGQTLARILKSGHSFSEAELTAMLGAMLSGLAVVHRAGYVHRDIKPANIMVRPDGQPVLLDFGAARQAIGRKTQSITTVLTPGYAPIEQYDQQADDIGPWTDIYALGMVFYRCVTGISDGELVDAVARARMQRKGEDPLTPAVIAAQNRYSNALLEAIDWAVAVNEEDRPQDVDALVAALPAFENRTEVSGRNATQAPTVGAGDGAPPRSGSPHPADHATRASPPTGMNAGAKWALGVTLFLVLAGIALGAGWVFWSGSPDGGEPPGSVAGVLTPETPEVAGAAPAAPQMVEPAYLVVRTNVSGDHVIVDGRDLGPSGRTRHELAPGDHEVRVEKRGYRPWRRNITLESGKTRTIKVTLRRLAGAAPSGGPDRWFAVFRSTDNGQRWVKHTTLSSFKDAIRKAWDDNYHLTRVTYTDGSWLGVFVAASVGCENRNGFETARTRSQFRKLIKQRWGEGFTLIDVAYGDGTWFGNFCEDARDNTYVTAATWDELDRKISQKWEKDGGAWHVISINHGPQGWLAVFVKGLCQGRNGWTRYASRADLEKALRESHREGFAVRNVEYVENTWIATRCEERVDNIYESAATWPEMKKKISARWGQGLDLVAVDHGRN